MKKFYFITVILFFIGTYIFVNSCNSKKNSINAEAFIKNYYSNQIDSTLTHLSALELKIKKKSNINELKLSFLESRLSYKKIESIVEYYFQGLTKRINGPALPDVKTEDGVIWPPHGFQVIEAAIFDNYSDSTANTIINEINVLKTDLKFTINNLKVITILPNHIEELIQHQIIRVAAMGITGFDAPISQYSLQEAVSSLKGLEVLVKGLGFQKGNEGLAKSITYLTQNNDFNTFDRLEFLTKYLMPLSEALLQSPSTISSKNEPFKGGLSSLLKGKSYNADYFTNYAIAATNNAKIALGKKLFYDNILSQTQNISCASCHQPDLYFTDGKVKAENFVHGGSLSRNTPTVLYAGFQNNQFYDARSVSLEDQVNEVMNNKNEFNLNNKEAQQKMLSNSEYKRLFGEAFGIKDSITSFFIRNAIASYVRSLSSFSSPFDAYMNGNGNALTAQQISGFNLFAGKAKCATCHFIPLFNGTIPPWYNKTESEIIGVPLKPLWQNASIDSDSGRYRINAFTELLYAFKTPTVRNVAKTAPYMHNGVYNSLEEVVEFYHKGGGIGLGINLPFQSLPFDSLQLNKDEKKAIVLFMQSLTDVKPVL